MKLSKITSLVLAAFIAVAPLTGCGTKKSGSKSSKNTYSANKEIGKNKINVSINETTDLNDTTFRINRIIDSGKTTDDGLKFIYVDVTIKNNMDTAYDVNALNNFYLILDDKKEVFTDIRTDIYAKQSVEGYQQLLEVPANSEFNGYIGFLLNPDVTSFTLCYFATKNKNDKETVIRCPITKNDIISAPSGFIK